MLSIVIPCYNEGNNLKIIFEKIGQIYESMNELEVILVDLTMVLLIPQKK